MAGGFRKIALVAAILLGALRLHGLIAEATYVFPGYSPPLVLILANALLLLPLPVLLFLVYRTRATPMLPPRLAYLAVALALADGAFPLGSGLPRLIRDLRHLSDFELFRRDTIAAQLWMWLRQPMMGAVMWDLFDLCAYLSFVLFLVALAERADSGEPGAGGSPDSDAVRIAGLIATAVGGFSFFASLIRLAIVYFTAERYIGAESDSLLLVRNAWHPILPSLCWALSAWIIYRSYPRVCAAAPASEPVA